MLQSNNIEDSGVASIKTARVLVEKVVYEGGGLLRMPNGQVKFVHGVMPGETVIVEYAESDRSAWVRLLEIVEPSSRRIKPSCSVFEQCGGCQWQYMPLPLQREWKNEIAFETLQRVGKISTDLLKLLKDKSLDVSLDDLSESFRYRNRVQWKVVLNGNRNELRLGYQAHKSLTVVPFDDCVVISELMNAVAKWFRENLNNNAWDVSALTQIEVIQNRNNQLLLTLVVSTKAELKALVEKLRSDFSEVVGVLRRVEGLGKNKKSVSLLYGSSVIHETVLNQQYEISGQSFFQTNIQVVETMIMWMETYFPEDVTTLIDLYAGVGLFAKQFYSRVKDCFLLEESEAAVKMAKRNFASIPNCHIVAGDILLKLDALPSAEVVIIDPPRAGVSKKVLDWLTAHVIQRLFYISCNPSTLARDVKYLMESGMSIDAVRVFDMFPQTYHIEMIVCLSPKPR